MKALLAALLLLVPIARAGTSDGPPTADPAQLYQQSCAACHDHPKDRIPPRATIARHAPDEVMQILTSGSMQAQAAGLSMNDRVALASYLTGSAPPAGLRRYPRRTAARRRLWPGIPGRRGTAGAGNWRTPAFRASRA
jgi:mono/diheme cytochrome c family protein